VSGHASIFTLHSLPDLTIAQTQSLPDAFRASTFRSEKE
jgi:hypothetical protein